MKNVTRSHGSVSIWGLLFNPVPGHVTSARRHRLYRSDSNTWCHFNWHLRHHTSLIQFIDCELVYVHPVNMLSNPVCLTKLHFPGMHFNIIPRNCALILQAVLFEKDHANILHALLSFTVPDKSQDHHNILRSLSVTFYCLCKDASSSSDYTVTNGKITVNTEVEGARKLLVVA